MTSDDHRQSFQVLEWLYPAEIAGSERPALGKIVQRSLVSTLAADDHLLLTGAGAALRGDQMDTRAVWTLGPPAPRFITTHPD